MTGCLDAALAYAAHGWPVLPLNGKVPSLKDWTTASSTDPATIRRWWTAKPSSNVGLVTGLRSGLAVVDIDPRSGGTDSLSALEARAGVLPGTVMSVTGGGGCHLLHAHPGGKITSSAHQLGRGLDVKGDGGQIVAPPSVHPQTGLPYSWLNGVWDAPLTPWPVALTPAPEPTQVPFSRPLPTLPDAGAAHIGARFAGVVQAVMDAVEGDRNKRLHWAACRGAEMTRGGLLPVAAVGDALLMAAQAVGLDRASATATIQSGLRTGPRSS